MREVFYTAVLRQNLLRRCKVVVWTVALSKIVVEEEEASVYSDVGEALAACDELEEFLGIQDVKEVRLKIKCSPVTGEWLMVTLKSEVQDG